MEGGRRYCVMLLELRALKKEEEDALMSGVKLATSVIATRPVKGCRVKRKGDRIDLPSDSPLFIGPRETKTIILPYTVTGSGFRTLVCIN